MEKDTDFKYIECELKGNAKLARFINPGGAEYSAIYINNYEAFNCPRDKESDMIKQWNSSSIFKKYI